MANDNYLRGLVESSFGPLAWCWADEDKITFRNVDDAIDIHGVLYACIVTVEFRETAALGKFLWGESMLTRQLSRKEATNNARASMAREAERLANELNTEENRLKERIYRTRRNITETEDEITSHTECITDLMQTRGQLTSQLESLLAERGRTRLGQQAETLR